MLIYIDDSIKDTLLRNCNAENKAKIENVFQDMYTSLRKNRHIIFGEPDSIDTLMQYYKPINGTLYNFFHMINSDLPTKYDFLNNSLRPIFYAHVFFDDKKSNKRYNNHIEVNINNLDKDNDLFEYPTRLLVENPDDSKFYGKVVEHYINNHTNFVNLFYSFKYANGGGSVIKACYEDFAKEENAFCIAITDNDCIFDGYIVKDNSACKIVEKADIVQPFNCNFLVIDVRDIENLIPLEVIETVKPIKVRRIKQAINGNTSKKDIIIKYFDYKLGITQKKNDNTAEKKQELKYWEQLFGAQYQANPITDNNRNIYVEGFGKDILKHSLSCINDSLNLNSTLLDNAWEKIGKFIFSYCCTVKSVNQFPNY